MYKFFAFLNRMKLIRRWSLMHSVYPENIAEHSAQVAFVAHALATISNTYFANNLNADSIAVKALFHETSEVLTGDLPTPIKYFNPEIRDAYKNLEKGANEKLLAHLPAELQQTFGEIVNNDDPIEHAFVKYADKICAYLKCIDEEKIGNSEFAKAKQTLKKDIDEFNSKEVDWFMQNFVPAYSLTLDELD